jgi:Trypsin
VWAPGRTAFATGWGALSEGGAFPDQLREVQLAMISDSTCDSPFINGISPGFDAATMSAPESSRVARTLARATAEGRW